jgi:hypothetical protein
MSCLVSNAFGRLCLELKMVPMPRSSREPKVSREGSSGVLNEHIGTTLGTGLGRVNAIATWRSAVEEGCETQTTINYSLTVTGTIGRQGQSEMTGNFTVFDKKRMHYAVRNHKNR